MTDAADPFIALEDDVPVDRLGIDRRDTSSAQAARSRVQDSRLRRILSPPLPQDVPFSARISSSPVLRRHCGPIAISQVVQPSTFIFTITVARAPSPTRCPNKRPSAWTAIRSSCLRSTTVLACSIVPVVSVPTLAESIYWFFDAAPRARLHYEGTLSIFGVMIITAI